ncbi:hypothetical protein, partial [Acinetobacter sp. NS4_7]
NRRITATSLEIQLKLKNRHGVQRTLTFILRFSAQYLSALRDSELSIQDMRKKIMISEIIFMI